MGGGEATQLKGMRGKQEGESEKVTMEHDCRVLLTPPIITLTGYPVLAGYAHHLFLTRPLFKFWYSPPLDLSNIDLPYRV